jgi:hypothetical protein
MSWLSSMAVQTNAARRIGELLSGARRRVADGEARDQATVRQWRRSSKRDKTAAELRKVSDPSGASKR